MSEVLANVLPVVALKEDIEWDEECYEQGELCSSEEEKAKTSTNKLTQKPEKRPIPVSYTHLYATGQLGYNLTATGHKIWRTV